MTHALIQDHPPLDDVRHQLQAATPTPWNITIPAIERDLVWTQLPVLQS